MTHFSFGEELQDGEGENHFQSTYLSDFKPITPPQYNNHSMAAGEINTKAPSYFSLGYDTGNYLETEAQDRKTL